MAEPYRTRRISSAAYQALRDALPVIVWYKKSFATFLRTALRDHPELLLGLDFDALKRDTADSLVERLMRQEEAYQHVTLRLMLEVAALDSFPELERLEDRATLVAKARSAVANLKAHTESHEELLIERERAEAAREAYNQQAALQQHFADELDDLKTAFYNLAAMPEQQSQERGRQFIDRYSRGTPFMTVDHSDLMCVLDQRARLDDILRRKKRHANETGECYFPVTRLFQ